MSEGNRMIHEERVVTGGMRVVTVRVKSHPSKPELFDARVGVHDIDGKPGPSVELGYLNESELMEIAQAFSRASVAAQAAAKADG